MKKFGVSSQVSKNVAGGLKRYRALLISFIVYVVLMTGLLVYNYQLNQRSTELNNRNDIVGRLSDNMLLMHTDINAALSEYLLDRSKGEEISKTINKIKDLEKESLGYFDLLTKGGFLKYDAGDTNVTITPLEDSKHLERFRKFRKLFDEVVSLNDKAFTQAGDSYNISLSGLTASSDFLNEHIDEIFDVYIEDTWDELLSNTQDLSQRSGYVIIAVTAITMLYFLVFVFYFVRQLGVADRRTAAARREVEDIMATVNEGLFLIDKDLVISSQYSHQLEKILGQTQIAGEKLDTLLENIISKEDLQTTHLFITQLMNKNVVSDLVESLNPLQRVRIKAGGPERFLSFNFSRVMEAGEIKQILVSAADITKEVELEERLSEANRKHNEQIEMLSSLLSTESGLVNAFLKKSRQTASSINEILKKQTRSEKDLLEKLDIIFREVHSLKGEASAVGLAGFVSLCDRFESRIAQLKRQAPLTGNDFLSIAVYLEDLEVLNDKVIGLYERINKGASLADVASNQTLVPALSQLTAQVAERNHKQVSLKTQNLEALPDFAKAPLQDVLIQMVRNAIVHGIEPEATRLAADKPDVGSVRIGFVEKEGDGIVIVEDDGKGIDFEALEKIAQSRGIEPDADGNYSEKRLLALMFGSGVSTAASAGEDAGRGVGTSVIQDRIRQIQGKISVKSEGGKFTRFTIRFPLQQ